MKVEQYMQRIDYKGTLKADLACLRQLHQCHVMAIPFEALDAYKGIPISTDIEAIYKKVILENRGGYCYELNHLFHHLLTKIGFENYLIAARVYDNGTYGPPFDHMAIIVNLDGEWLADVGYGDLFIEPFSIQKDLIQEDYFKFYKIESTDSSEYILYESLKSEINFSPSYQFDTQKQTIADFEEQNTFKYSSRDSHFVKNRICTLATANGRKTIRNNEFKVRNGKKTIRREIENDKDLNQILAQEFGLLP